VILKMGNVGNLIVSYRIIVNIPFGYTVVPHRTLTICNLDKGFRFLSITISAAVLNITSHNIPYRDDCKIPNHTLLILG